MASRSSFVERCSSPELAKATRAGLDPVAKHLEELERRSLQALNRYKLSETYIPSILDLISLYS